MELNHEDHYQAIAIGGATVLAVLIIVGIMAESPWLLAAFITLAIPWIWLLRKYQ